MSGISWGCKFSPTVGKAARDVLKEIDPAPGSWLRISALLYSQFGTVDTEAGTVSRGANGRPNHRCRTFAGRGLDFGYRPFAVVRSKPRPARQTRPMSNTSHLKGHRPAEAKFENHERDFGA